MNNSEPALSPENVSAFLYISTQWFLVCQSNWAGFSKVWYTVCECIFQCIFSCENTAEGFLNLNVAKASAGSLLRLQYLNVVGCPKPKAHVHPKQERHEAGGFYCEALSPDASQAWDREECGWEKQPQTKHLSKQTEEWG